jgi:hypothetical protein
MYPLVEVPSDSERMAMMECCPIGDRGWPLVAFGRNNALSEFGARQSVLL